MPGLPNRDAAPSLWQQQWPSPGWAPLQRAERTDVVVIGGGVTGCSTAWHLARAGVSVRLLEAREIASGASGRNGGFLLAGLQRRFGQLVEQVGSSRAAELYALTVEGRDQLYGVAAAIGVGACATQTGSLRVAVDATEVDDLDEEASLLGAAGFPVERLTASQLPGPLGRHMLAGLRFPGDGRSVPAGWVRALGSAAGNTGAVLHEHSPVVAIEDDGDGVVVRTGAGHEVRAEHVVVATEAWLPNLVPTLDGMVLPYRSQVLAAAPPLDEAGAIRTLLPHVTWSRRGWDYAQQTADGHLVVGGEQVEDVELVRHLDEAVVEADQAWLESWIRRVLEVEPQVVARWAGVLGQSADGFPFVGPLAGRPRVLVCGGWGGAGNVLGFVCGGLVAELAAGRGGRVPAEFAASRV